LLRSIVPTGSWRKKLGSCEDAEEHDVCIPDKSEKKKPIENCIGQWKEGKHYKKKYPVYRKVSKKTCVDDPWYDDDDGHKCSSIANQRDMDEREEMCGDEGTGETGPEWYAGYQACRLSCDSCGVAATNRQPNQLCSAFDKTFVIEYADDNHEPQGCEWIEAQLDAGEDLLSTCNVLGTSTRTGVETEVNAFRACGRSCGTCVSPW